ncbi:hypothetical protein P5V15_009793 [Pogonomyrmex californicus]
MVPSIASGVWYVSQRCVASGVEHSLALPNTPARECFPVECPSHGNTQPAEFTLSRLTHGAIHGVNIAFRRIRGRATDTRRTSRYIEDIQF